MHQQTAEPGRRGNPASRAGASRTAESYQSKQRSCTAKDHKDQPGLRGNHGDAANETEARLAMVLPGTNMPRPTGGAPCPRVALGMGLRQTGALALFPVPRPCGIVAVCGMGVATNLRSREAGRTLCAAKLCSVAAQVLKL